MENSQPYTSKLYGLLESLNNVHKKDIRQVCSVHLNENYLWRERKGSKTKIWESANKRLQRDTKDVGKQAKVLPPLEKNVSKMKGSMVDFAFGIDSENHLTNNAEMDKGLLKCQHKSESMLPDIMLPVRQKKGELPFSKRFVSTYFLQPSKKDQYKRLQSIHGELFEDGTNKKNSTVGKIDEKLQKKLRQLEKDQDLSIPNFYKLQAYSDAWEELCQSCETHQELLRSAKTNYDAYVTALLDEQLKLNKPLQDGIHIMTTENKDLKQVKNIEKDVERLEEEIMKELQQNKCLRRKLDDAKSSNQEISAMLQEETDRPEAEESRSREVSQLKVEDQNIDCLEDEVEALYAQIELQLHELEELKKDRRANHVPLIMCQRLENCIKETEIDIQKLCQQNEFLEHNMEELEEELHKTLLKAGMKPLDARALWRRVNKSRLLGN